MTMRHILGIALGAALFAASPAHAEPIADPAEVGALLAELGERCWAVDIDGTMLDADTMMHIEGPIDVELECVIAELKPASADARTRPLPAGVI